MNRTKIENTIIYINAESVLHNIGNIQIMMSQLSPNMLLCSEARLTPDIKNSEITVAGYKMFRCDSNSRHTGGVIVYAHKKLTCNVIANKVYENNLWGLTIEVTKSPINGIYSIIYHSPSSSDAQFIEFLTEYMEETFDDKKTYVLTGDFNIDMNKDTTYNRKLKRLINTNGCRQIIDFDTRTTSNTKTKIDLAITNVSDMKCKQNANHVISDHETIILSISKPTSIQKKLTREVIDWTRYSKEALLQNLTAMDWSDFGRMTTEDKVELVMHNTTKAVSSLTSIKTVTISTQNKWYDLEVNTLKNMKTQSYLTSKESPTNENWKKYTEIRNKYNNCVKSKKNQFTQNKICSAENNQQKMWKTLRKIIGSKTKEEHDMDVFENNSQ